MKIVTHAPALERPIAEALDASLAEAGVEVVDGPAGEDAADGGGARPRTAALAAALVDWERELQSSRAKALLIAGDDEPALAAALSAAKLVLPTLRLEAQGGEPDDGAPGSGVVQASNARLIALLVPDCVDPADPARAASEIAEWLRRPPTLPAR